MPRRPPSGGGHRRRATHLPLRTPLPIAMSAVGTGRRARRRSTGIWRPTDSARRPAEPPARRVSSALDRARRCPSVGGQNATSTCLGLPDAPADHSIAQPTTDSSHQLAPVRDLHVYAAYSTRPVADTGSDPRVSMPSHLPGPHAPIPVSAIYTVAVTTQRGRPETHLHRPAATVTVGSLSRTQEAVLHHCRRRGLAAAGEYLSARA